MLDNFDPMLFFAGFVVGGGCVGALGISLTQDYPRRYVMPATVVSVLLVGSLVGWSLNYFFHWARPSM